MKELQVIAEDKAQKNKRKASKALFKEAKKQNPGKLYKAKKTRSASVEANQPGVSLRASRKKSRKSESDSNDKSYHCIFCRELYVDPPIESWIQCQICEEWAHEECTGGCGSRGYTCDICDSA